VIGDCSVVVVLCGIRVAAKERRPRFGSPTFLRPIGLVGFLSATLLLVSALDFSFLLAVLFLSYPSRFGLLEFFLSATLLLVSALDFSFLLAVLFLSYPSGFGLLEFFLSATLLLGSPTFLGFRLV